eukprot:gene13465-28533_t
MFKCNAFRLPSIATQNIRKSESTNRMIFSSIRARIPWFSKKKVDLEEVDIDLLVRLNKVAESLCKAPLDPAHPLHEISRKLKENIAMPGSTFPQMLEIARTELQSTYSEYATDFIDFDENFPEGVPHLDQMYWRVHTGLRLLMCSQYVTKLQKAIQDNDISLSDEKNNTITALRLVDAFLLGSSSERISEHFELYSPKISHSQVQESFYHLLEPEITACITAFTQIKGMHKHHKKELSKFAKAYLLDTRELNVKTRCVFCWSETTFSGFKPLPDDHMIAVDAVLSSRRKFFKESDEIAALFMKDYTGERRLYYHGWKEFRETCGYGVVFFFGTIVFDVLVTSL